MKKVVVFIAIAVMAAITQGATISWKSGAMYVPNADGTLSSTKAKATVNATIFLVSADVYNTYKEASSLDIYNASSTIAAAATETKTGKSASLSSASNITTDTDFAKGETAYAIAIYTTTVDGTDFVIAKAGYDTINDLDAASGIASTGLASGNWTKVEAVPEPCTIALLALGLAAVGLKRKVA